MPVPVTAHNYTKGHVSRKVSRSQRRMGEGPLERDPHAQLRGERNPYRRAGAKEIS